MCISPSMMSGGGGSTGGFQMPWGSIAKSALGGAEGLFGGLSNKKAQKEAAKNYNDWLSTRGQLIAEGGGGTTGMVDVLKAINSGQDPRTMGGLIGALAQSGTNIFGPEKRSTETSGTSSGTSTSSYNRLSMPEWAKQDQLALNMMRGNVEGRLDAMNKGYAPEIAAANRQAANIGEAGRIAERGALARKGLSSLQQPVGPSQRVMNQQILNNQALLPGQLRGQDAAMAQSFLGMTRGQRDTGRETSSFQNTMNQLQTMMSPPDYMRLLAFLQPPSPQAGSAGAGFATLSGIAAGLGKG